MLSQPLYLAAPRPRRFTHRHALPLGLQGLSCDGVSARCVLQWYYLTGNSCDPPGTPAPYSRPLLGTCGAGVPYPEEFL